MRLRCLLVCVLALHQVWCARPNTASRAAAAEDTHRRTAPPTLDQLDEDAFAWVVQTGRSSAEEAVAAIMVTFLQSAAAHAGFVADVQSTGKVRLADTAHEIEKWSLAHWENAWPQSNLGSDQVVDADADSLKPPSLGFPHGAHKVLPGFNLMHAKWPEASWYVMIDDDTFVFRRALAKLLSDLDPEEKHYIGYPRQGAHMCRDPTAAQHYGASQARAPFALGGCGMILSKAAMKRLAQVVVECTMASQDCYLDDVRLFFCLRDIGIHLNTSFNYPAMNFAPNKNIDWSRVDPCTRPVVFHGVTPMEMHMLHAADLKRHGQATMADIFAELSVWGVHSARSGQKYGPKHMMNNISDVVDQRDCRMHCEQQHKCKAWNFATEGKYCELIDHLTAPQENWRFSSGISQPAYICHPTASMR